MNNRELKTIIKLFEDSELSSMKLEKDDVKIELTKPNPNDVQPIHYTSAQPINEPPRQAPSTEQPKEASQLEPSNYTKVKAPLVGTYYEAPAPDQPPFVREGQMVRKGDTLCIIEAMKVMNEISAPKDGKIVKIHAENGDMVMFDQLILEIE